MSVLVSQQVTEILQANSESTVKCSQVAIEVMFTVLTPTPPPAYVENVQYYFLESHS